MPFYNSTFIYGVGALFWESMSLLSLLREHSLTALLAHLLCAASLGCAAGRGRPFAHARSAGSIAAWALCVPVVAPLGLCLIVLPALRRLRAHSSDGVLEIQRARPKPTVPRSTHSRSLREMLHEMAADPTQRVAALMSLRHTELARAAPLLRAALLDANEDLRLLAYALLERREKLVRARIEAGTAELARLADTPESIASQVLLEQLCFDHWLLVRASFVSGDHVAETLDIALDYGERALWLNNDGALRVLLARIYLRADKAERALLHLGHAERLGTAHSVLSPLFAQAAFLLGHYEDVGSLLRVSAAARLANPEQQGARTLWAGQALR